MFAKNFILSLVSLVVFAALAAISTFVYQGGTEQSVEINERDLVNRARSGIERIWHFTDGQPETENTQNSEALEATFSDRFMSEWKKDSETERDIMAYISEKTKKMKNIISEAFSQD